MTPQKKHTNNLAKHIADGLTAKLNFDYACHRGHGFGEYHVHGVINEILCARTDPTEQRVVSGYALPGISSSKNGRKKEIDLVVCDLPREATPKQNEKKTENLTCAIEVKWAGSSHCKEENILRDLSRLQWLANSDQDIECLFVLSGTNKDMDGIFGSGKSLFAKGTNCLLSRHKMKNKSMGSVKHFNILNNKDHKPKIEKLIKSLETNDSWFPDLKTISTKLVSPETSAPDVGRFQTYVWKLQYRKD